MALHLNVFFNLNVFTIIYNLLIVNYLFHILFVCQIILLNKSNSNKLFCFVYLSYTVVVSL